MPALTDAESRWFTIYVHTCDTDPRGSGDRPTEGKQYVGQAAHSLHDIKRGFADTAERAMQTRWRHKRNEKKSALALAVREFGADHFRHEIVDVVLGQEAANRVEDEWITKLDSLEPRGYNRRRGGQSALASDERSKFCKAGWAKVPSEQRKAIARKRIDSTPQEELSRRASKRAITVGHEKMSSTMKGVWESRSTEEREAIAAKRIENTDFGAASQKAMETLGPDGLRGRARNTRRTRRMKALIAAEKIGDHEKVAEIRSRIEESERLWQLSTDELRRLQESLSAGVPLKDLAARLRVSYMALYHALRADRTT